MTLASIGGRGWMPWWHALGAAGAAFVVLYAIAMATDLGYGDVKLTALIADCAGYGSPSAAFTVVLAGFLLAALAGVTLLIARRRGSEQPIAMGPWLLLGAAGTLPAI